MSGATENNIYLKSFEPKSNGVKTERKSKT